MTDHAAHRDVSRWATQALHEAGKPGSSVHYATVTPEWAEEFVPIWEPFNVFRPGTPVVTPRDELSIDYRLPADINDLKVKAILEHKSQVGAIFEAVGEDVWWREMSTESFRLGEEKR
jgi:hypothetical protein